MLFSEKLRWYLAPDAEDGADVPTDDVPADDVNTGGEELIPDEPVEPAVEEPQSLTSLGFPTDDPQALKSQWDDLNSRAQQARQIEFLYAQQMRQMQEQQAAAAKAAEKPAEKPAPPWKLPDFDPSLKKFLRADAEGNITVIPGGDPTLAQRYQEWLDAKEQAQQKFLHDPLGSLQPLVEPLIEQKARAVAEQMFREQAQRQWQAEQQRLLKQYEQTYKDIYLNKDGSPNNLGQQWNYHHAQAVQFGLPNPIEYAHNMMDAIFGRALMDQQGQQAAEPSKAERDLNFLKNRAGRVANRSTDGNGRTRVASKVTKGEAAFENLSAKWKGMDPKEFEFHGRDE